MCDRKQQLIGFLYGELDPAEAHDFEQHLFTCAECRNDARDGSILVVLVDRNELLASDTVVAQESRHHTRILRRNGIDLLQHVQRAQRHVAQVTDGSSDYI